MDKKINQLIPTNFLDNICTFCRGFLFQVLAFGPIPRHISFIPDGNRRYGRKMKLQESESHSSGLFSLMNILRYCYEMGIQYVSVYAFSIDNFKRKPTEVQIIMNLIKDNINAMIQDQTTLNSLGVRIQFLGNLDLVDESTRETVRKCMAATAKNTNIVLLVCLAYTSTDEIVYGVQGTWRDKWGRANETKDCYDAISLEDLERRMYFAGYQDPDILIRTSGETSLSNYVLWQTKSSLLYAPYCLWPEISFKHLVCAVIEFQRNYEYLERIKKKK